MEHDCLHAPRGTQDMASDGRSRTAGTAPTGAGRTQESASHAYEHETRTGT